MSLIGSGGPRPSPGTRGEEGGLPVVVVVGEDRTPPPPEVSVVAAVASLGAADVAAAVVTAAVLAACSACQGDGSGVAVRSSSQGGRCLEVVVESETMRIFDRCNHGDIMHIEEYPEPRTLPPSSILPPTYFQMSFGAYFRPVARSTGEAKNKGRKFCQSLSGQADI